MFKNILFVLLIADFNYLSNGAVGPYLNTNGSTIGACDSYFPNGKFRTGLFFDQIATANLDNYDYLFTRLNSINSKYGTDFNPKKHGAMLDLCKSLNKIPVFYAYIIAHEANYQFGYRACNVDPDGLCINGANFIRNYKSLLYDRYTHQALSIANWYGTSKPIIILIEPDFWIYHGADTQKDGPLTMVEMQDLFYNFMIIIRSYLPNSRIGWNISPWIDEATMIEWWGYFKDLDIQYIFTDVSQVVGDTAEMKPKGLTWRFMTDLTGKNIIAGCGNGPNDMYASTTCFRWANDSVINNRILDGVIALSLGNENATITHKPNFNC